MRKRVLPFILILLNTFFVFSQKDTILTTKNIIGIKTNILCPADGESLSFTGEYYFTNKISAGITYSFGTLNFGIIDPLGSGLLASETKYKSILPEIRIHFAKQKEITNEGFFAGGYFRGGEFILTKYDLFDPRTILEQQKIRAIGGGLIYGYQWVFNLGITMDAFIGMGGMYYIDKQKLFLYSGFEEEYTNNSQGDLRIGFNIGYTFTKKSDKSSHK